MKKEKPLSEKQIQLLQALVGHSKKMPYMPMTGAEWSVVDALDRRNLLEGDLFPKISKMTPTGILTTFSRAVWLNKTGKAVLKQLRKEGKV